MQSLNGLILGVNSTLLGNDMLIQMKTQLLFLIFSALVGSTSAWAQQTVICLGDSLTAGYGIDGQLAYPQLIQNRLSSKGMDVKVVNAGMSGSTTASGMGRYRWLVKAHGVPDVLLLALGANDGLRGQSVEHAKANLLAIIEQAQKDGAKVLLAGMKIPTNYGSDYARSFEKIFEELGAKPDVTSIPFLLEGVAMNPKLNLPDRIHPNPSGHRIMADTVMAHLEPLLKGMSKS